MDLILSDGILRIRQRALATNGWSSLVGSIRRARRVPFRPKARGSRSLRNLVFLHVAGRHTAGCFQGLENVNYSRFLRVAERRKRGRRPRASRSSFTCPTLSELPASRHSAVMKARTRQAPKPPPTLASDQADGFGSQPCLLSFYQHISTYQNTKNMCLEHPSWVPHMGGFGPRSALLTSLTRLTRLAESLFM